MTCQRSLSSILTIVLLSLPTNAYLFGDFDIAYCWETTNFNTSTEVQTRNPCDSSVTMAWIVEPPSTVEAGEKFSVSFVLTVNSSIHSPMTFGPVGQIPHTNIHRCPTDMGLCTPTYTVSTSSNLITETESQHGSFSSVTGSADLIEHITYVDMDIPVGTWTVVAHTVFGTFEGQVIVRDVAIGVTMTVGEEKGYLRSDVERFGVGVTGVTYIYIIVLSIMTLTSASIQRAADPILLGLQIIGGILFVTTTFFWTLYMTDFSCAAFPCFANIGFTLLCGPLFAKALAMNTFSTQHSPLLDTHNKAGSTKAKEKTLMYGVIAIALAVDTLLLSIWLSKYRPTGKPAELDAEYREECNNSSESKQIAAIVFTFQCVLLVAGGILSWTTSRKGYHRLELSRLRSTFVGIMISGLIVLIVEAAFDGDPELNFLIRAVGMCLATVFALYWVVQVWNEGNMLSRFAERRKYGNVATSSHAETENTSYIGSQGESKFGNIDPKSMEGFEEMFKSSIIRGYIFNFALKTLSTESVEFCDAVYRYKENPKINSARKIVDVFISNSGEKSVNISANIRNKTLKNLEEINKAIANKENDELIQKGLKALFNKSFNECRRLVYVNSWKEFQKSEHGATAAVWLDWLEHMDGHSDQENAWVVQDILTRAKKFKIDSKTAGLVGRIGNEGKSLNTGLFISSPSISKYSRRNSSTTGPSRRAVRKSRLGLPLEEMKQASATDNTRSTQKSQLTRTSQREGSDISAVIGTTPRETSSGIAVTPRDPNIMSISIVQ